MLESFQIHRPESVGEASTLMGEFGTEAAFYAGGTELLVVMKEGLTHFPHLIDVKTIPGLREITYDASQRELTIGAVTTHRQIERSPLVREHLPALADLEASVANVRVRSAGTIGGNLCFAEPHSDPATLLIALGARLTLASTGESREVALEEFFTGLMETARRYDELLTAIHVPVPVESTGVAYERFKLHERPTAAVAAVVAVTDGSILDATLVAGSVGERPQRLFATEAALRGRPVSDWIAVEAGDALHDEVEVDGDAFESEPYKRQLARTMGRRAIATALDRASHQMKASHAA
jgi:carbon-monoxide dehydrogenase medium subunit